MQILYKQLVYCIIQGAIGGMSTCLEQMQLFSKHFHPTVLFAGLSDIED